MSDIANSTVESYVAAFARFELAGFEASNSSVNAASVATANPSAPTCLIAKAH
jgi:hypothetical protein